MSYIRTFVTSLVISSIVYHWDHTLVHWGIIDITIICHNCFNITTDDILGHCSLLCCMSDHLRWHSLLHHNYVLHILMFSDVIHPLICQSCCDVICSLSMLSHTPMFLWCNCTSQKHWCHTLIFCGIINCYFIHWNCCIIIIMAYWCHTLTTFWDVIHCYIIWMNFFNVSNF